MKLTEPGHYMIKKSSGFISDIEGEVNYLHVYRQGKKLFYRHDQSQPQEIKTDGYFSDEALQIDGGQFISKSDRQYPHSVRNVKMVIEFEDESGYTKKLTARNKSAIARIFEVFPILKKALQ